MTVRLARADDLPHVADIERSAGERFRGTHMDWAADADPTGLDELEPALARGELWIADLGAGPVGFLLGYALDDAFYIREVSVRRDDQGKGLGRQLVEAATAHARARGLAGVTLTTDALIDWNRPLYERLGFRMLEDGELPPALAAKLSEERAQMPPSARRCAMRLDL